MNGRRDMSKIRATEQTMDARIAAAFADDATSADVSILLAEVEAAASAAEADAEAARARALDPLLSRDDVKLARREMEDAAFTRDRLHQAGTKLTERVAALKALEAARSARGARSDSRRENPARRRDGSLRRAHPRDR